jgi:hypothetical protein
MTRRYITIAEAAKYPQISDRAELDRRRHQGHPLTALGGGWNEGVEAEASAESTLLVESALARTRGDND